MTAEEYLKSKEPNTFTVPVEWLNEYAEIVLKTKGKIYSKEDVLDQLNLMYSMKNSLLETFTDEEDYITMKWFDQFKK